ncbi:hypothetical protein N7468_007876, partial [Penicillium chermesinum]
LHQPRSPSKHYQYFIYRVTPAIWSDNSNMSFHVSAVEYELEDGHILKAVLTDDEGNEKTSQLDLNTIIDNDNGSFAWKDSKYSDSANDVKLSKEGDDEVPVLRARLLNVDGEEVDADINLAERITNDNGVLRFN